MPLKTKAVIVSASVTAKADKFADNPIWTKAEFATAKRMTDLPASLQAKLATSKVAVRKRGPQKSRTKVPVTMRLSPDVVEYLRTTGDGWQTRVDGILRAWVQSQPKPAK